MGGPATTRGVLSEISCKKAASIPTRSRSGPVGSVVWLWSFRWSSVDDALVTANTPCNQPKQASDQPNCEVVGTKKTRNAYVV